MHESRRALQRCNVFGKRKILPAREEIVPLTIDIFFAQSAAGELVGPRNDQYEVATASVQQTIQHQAAGGQIVRVRREDDLNGRWNYEVTVKTNGKEWGFEVDPNGKVVKKHG